MHHRFARVPSVAQFRWTRIRVWLQCRNRMSRDDHVFRAVQIENANECEPVTPIRCVNQRNLDDLLGGEYNLYPRSIESTKQIV